MKLYQLPSVYVWYGGIYARTKTDLKQLLPKLRATPYGPPHTEEPSRPVNRTDISLTEKAIIDLDTSGPMLVHQKPSTLPITPELEVITNLETVAHFREIQKQFRSAEKVGRLRIIGTYCGPLPRYHFLPEDLFESLLSFDIAPYEPWAKKHEELLRRKLRLTE